MRVVFESRDANASQLRELAIERVRFALRRLTAGVPLAKVQFSDVNGELVHYLQRTHQRPTLQGVQAL